MSDEQNTDVKELLDKLMNGGDSDEPFIMVGGEEGGLGVAGAPPAPQKPADMLVEGQEVTIAGTLESGETLTIQGVICGVAPIVGPLGPMGFDYVVRVSNPEMLPTAEDGSPYPYSCVTAPPHLVTKSGE